MAFPAPSSPQRQWLYVSDAVTTYLGNNTTVNWNPTGVATLLCYAYAQGYTGLALYQIDNNTNFYTGGTTLTAAGIAKLQDFIAKAGARNLEVGIASSTKPAFSDALVDFNTNHGTSGIITRLFTENEFWAYSFNKTAQQPGTGTYSLLTMKQNLLSKKVALNNAGIKIFGYLGWTHDYHYIYSTPYTIILADTGTGKFSISGNHTAEFQAGWQIAVQGSTGNNGFYTIVSAVFSLGLTEISVVETIPSSTPGGTLGSDVVINGSEIQNLNGVLDIFGIHIYTRVPSYGYGMSRTRQINFPAELEWIISAESDVTNATGGYDANSNFEGHFLQGQNPTAPYAQVYTRKNILDCYKYITVDTNALGYTPPQTAGTPRYFNAETNSTVLANVDVKGIVVFATKYIIPLITGDGPRIYVNAGNDITVTTLPGVIGLGGVVCDDGLPPSSTLTYSWTVVSGPTTGVFSPSNTVLNPDFDFTDAGTYIIRLTATDGTVTSYDEFTLYANAIPTTKTITIDSVNPSSGVNIAIDILDINGNQNGTTSFTRYYNTSDTPTLTAPLTVGLNTFQKWLQDGVDFSFLNVITSSDSSDHSYTAVYLTPVTSGDIFFVGVTANQANTPYTVSQLDIYNNPVSLSGTVVENLFYYGNTTVSFTYPAIHPVTGQSIISVQTFKGGVLLNTFAGNVGVITFDDNYIVKANYDPNTPSPNDYFRATIVSGVTNCSAGTFTVTALVQSPGTFTYLWSTGATTDTVSLPAGVYTCLITNTPAIYAHPTMLFSHIVVSSPDPITLDFNVVNAVCGASINGQAQVIPTGGYGPYTYLWDTGATTDSITGPAGTYNVTVTDSNGCTVNDSVTITTQSPVVVLSSSVTNLTCNGSGNGELEVVTTGGLLPITYTWSKSGSGASFPNASLISGLDAGTYFLDIEDSNGCTVPTLTFTVTEPGAITFNIKLSGSACTNTDLTLSVENLVNAVAPVSYFWSNGGTGSTLYLGFLAAGNYIYGCTITDANGCTATSQLAFTVSQAPSVAPVVTVVTNTSYCTGTSYQLSVSGTGAFSSFIWSPTGETTTTITHLSSTITAPTDFYVTAYNSSGCSIHSNVITLSPASPTTIDVAAITNVACGGPVNTGAVDITVTGGCSPYTYLWSNGATTQDISGLTVGDYTVTVTDSQGGTASLTAHVVLSSPVVTAVVINTGCPGTATGSIITTVNGGTAPYTYLWNNGQTTADLSGLGVGVYQVTVTDDNGCTGKSTFFISNSGSPVNLSFQYTNPTSAGADGVINVDAAGGVAPYTYLWSTGAITQTINNLNPGTYTVRVSDANNCSAIGTITLFNEIQEEIEVLSCCAADLGYKYVWQMQNGLESQAVCTMDLLTLLHGYISDLCRYSNGDCLTNTQLQNIIQKAKSICGCCGCSDDIYDDTLKN